MFYLLNVLAFLLFSNISLTFGGVTCVAGFLGVALGSELSRKFRHRDGRADALVCAFGLLSCLPFVFLGLIFASKNTILCWVSKLWTHLQVLSQHI